jgi:WD40-like Beta Propeller Repeat.
MKKQFIATMLIASLIGSCTEKTTKTADDPIITKTSIEVVNGEFTPEIMHQLGKVSDLQLSPDGSRILYGVTYTSIEENKGNRELFIINTDGTDNTKITNTAKSEANARWIDDNTIMYMRGGKIYKSTLNGKQISSEKEVNNTPDGVEAFELSPSADKIMYIKSIQAAVKPTDLYPDLKKSSGRTYSDLMYRHWDHFVEVIPHTFVATFGENGFGESKDILAGDKENPESKDNLFELPTLPFGGLEQLSWSSDGKYIAYSCRKLSGKKYAYSTNTDIYLYNTENGDTQNITRGMMGYDTDPSFSPDGKKLAWISMEREGYEADKKRLFVVDMEKVFADLSSKDFSKYMKELTTDYKYNVESISWAPKSDKIYFNSCVNALTALFEVDVNKVTGKPIADNLATGSLPKSYGEGIRRITKDDAWFDFNSATILANADGSVKELLTTNTSMMRPAEIVSVNPQNGEVKEITCENKEIFDKLDTPTIEQRWMTTVDGKKMHTGLFILQNLINKSLSRIDDVLRWASRNY